MSGRKKPTSPDVRAALKARVQRTQPYDIWHTDPAEHQATVREAITTKRLALAATKDADGKIKPGDQATIDQADAAIKAAEAAIASCRVRIHLRPLSNAVLEQLEQAHPDETTDDYELAVLARSADCGLTAAEWRNTFAGIGDDGEVDEDLAWSRADRVELIALALEVQRTPQSKGFPKG